MRNVSRYAWLAVLLALAANFGQVGRAVAGGAARTRVYAKVDAETVIYPGDEFVYSIVVEGGGKPSKIDTSPLAEFNPRRAGSGTSMQTVGDRTTVSYSENYAITAGKAGTMRLPGVTVVVDGQTYTTEPVEVKVSQPGTTDRLSLELALSEQRCYVGQPIMMSVKWIITTSVEGGTFEVPVFQTDDFYLEDPPEPAAGVTEQLPIHGVPVTISMERRSIRGVDTRIVSFRKILIPKHSGRIRLDPVSVSANMAVGRVRTNDLFNPYQIKYQRVSVPSNPVELEVLPLPEVGKPPQFSGLVGRYTISASATPTKVNVGDPITLTIRVGGNPYLKPVPWPALEQVPELANNFRIPAEKASPVTENGYKTFTQTIRANNDTVTEIPTLSLAYFDPQKGAYVVARTEPIKLEVAPTKVLTNADVEGTASGPINREVEAVRKGLSANYYGPEVLADQSFSLLSAALRPGYAVIWSIPLLALLASSLLRVSRQTSPESLARKRRRQAATTAIRQLSSVAIADPGNRHELLLLAMRGYIGDRFDRVAASLTADECSQAILEVTGDAALAAQYRDLIAASEAARYSPLQAEIGPRQVRAAMGLIESVERQAGARAAGRKQHGLNGWLLVVGCSLLVLGWPAATSQAQLANGSEPSATGRLSRDQLNALLLEANSAFQQANTAQKPDLARPLYDKAILVYEKIIEQGGIHNSRLYYNLANAYLLKDDLGRAILNYRRAARLDSADLNIQKNLTFARSRRVDTVEVGTQKRVLETLFFWHYDLGLRTRFLLVCVYFAVLCGALTAIVWRGRGPAATAAVVLSAVLLLCFLASILVETRRQAKVHSGVITAKEVVARQGDGPNYPASFKDALHAGTEFELLEHRPGWMHLRLSNGTDAWIPDDTAELI